MPQHVPSPGRSPLRWPGWYAVAVAAVALAALTALFSFDPGTTRGFLPCPFRAITGLLCPGCGSQRAMHDLLHGNFTEAFQHNAALVIAIPLLGVQWLVPRLIGKENDPTTRNYIVYSWLVLIVAWGILRNFVPSTHLCSS